MRDDTSRWSIWNILGGALLLWAIVKMSVIGYYPDEAVPQVIIPFLLAAALLGIGSYLRSRER